MSLCPEARSWVEETRKAWRLPATIVSAVSKKDEGFETDTYVSGTRDGEQPVEPDSPFLIASCSKLFVPTAIGILIADGVKVKGKTLAWTTKLKDILEWKLHNDIATEYADLVDLLSMRLGLPGHDRMTGAQSPADLVQQLRHLRFSHEFRQTRMYSNIGYSIGSEVVRVLSGMSYIEFVTQRIFKPLGMDSSSFALPDNRVHSSIKIGVQEQDAAKAWHRYRKGDGPLENAMGTPRFYEWDGSSNSEISAGAGGIWSTAKDMEIRETIYTPHTYGKPPSNENTGHFMYGLGTYVFTYRGNLAYCHGGACPGQYSYQVVLPEKGKGVFVYSNDDEHSPWLNTALAYTVMDSLLGLPPHEDWLDLVMDQCFDTKEPKECPVGDSPDVSGRYTNAVYPDLEIQPLSEHDEVYHHLDLVEARSSERIRGRKMFYAKAVTIFIDGMLFVHDHDDVFSWLAVKGYKSKDSMIFYAIDGQGKCAFENGLGFGGDLWGSGGKRSVEVKEGMREDEFEVWYSKE